MWDDLVGIDHRFAYHGERTRHLAFPLGGIGAGGFSISGSGRLIDWSIRNRPALQGYNGYSHFAIKAEKDGDLVDARVMNGPYDLDPSGAPGLSKMFDGFGHGANRQTLAGVPHFREVDFYGRFPTADLVFRDRHFPGGLRMTAFSPFIPMNERDSGMPVAMFEIEIDNNTADALTYTLAGTLGNYGANSGDHSFTQDGRHLQPLPHLLRPRPQTHRPRQPHHRHRRSGRRAHRPPFPRPVVRQPRGLLEGIRPPRPPPRPPLRHPPHLAPHEPAARARHPRRPRHHPRRREAQAPLRHLLELPRGRHLLGLPHQPRRADPRQAHPLLAQLVRHRMARQPRQRPRGADPLGRPQIRHPRLPRRPLRLHPPGGSHRRRQRHARAPAHRHRHPARRRRDLGLGRPAHPGRLLRRLLHPCLELPAGALPPLPRPRAHAPRDRVRLQPAPDRRAHLPPEAPARLRLRRDRPLRRRPFRRHRQDLPRLEALRRHRLAAPPLAQRPPRHGICLEPGEPRPLGPRRPPASSPAASTRPSTWSSSSRIPGSARCMSPPFSPPPRWPPPSARPTSPT